MRKPIALIVDDESDLRELLAITLDRMHINSHGAANITDAKNLLQKQHYDLCLTDIRLPDGNGLDFLAYIKAKHPNTPVAIITAYGNMDTAITALRHGAFDFFIKPIELETLRNLINRIVTIPAHGQNNFNKISTTLLGKSPAIINLATTIKKLAQTDAPVIINGPSGSGKELVARLLHNLGSRAKFPFVPINCGAIPRELMESEFFGHRKGSFTGALQDKPGLFQAAQNGTLLLDEIGELPLDMQVKLLRAIQERCVRQIGSTSEDKIDVRILGATHKNLRNLVQQGLFREDLFYRINVIEITVPSLAERTEDIPLLIAHILEKIVTRKKIALPIMHADSINLLCAYNYPGNIRELENILERAIALQENGIIYPRDLGLADDVNKVTSNIESCVDDVERNIIVQALDATNGSKPQAAKKLGISLRMLRYRLKKLGLS